jgi:translation initiation factor 2D
MHTNKTSSTHGLVFPLNSSFIMSELILPFLPTFTPAQTASLQIKKTSWKNLKKFIKALEKEQLLKSKDRNGGELVVLDIDFAERAFKDFTPYPLPRKEVTAGGKEGSASDTVASSGGDPSVGQHLRRLVFYKPKEKLAPIFEPSKSRYALTHDSSLLLHLH